MKSIYWVGAALVGGGLAAAGASAGHPAHLAASVAQVKAPAKPTPKPDPLRNMGGVGQEIYGAAPDPKQPRQTLWKAWIKTGGYANNIFSGQGISALLFNAGKLDAKLTAPQGIANSVTNVVVGSGGATYTSLVPAQQGTFGSTYLTAQTVTWNSITKYGIARGNVHYRNGRTGLVVTYPRPLYFNSGLRSFSSSPLRKGQ